MNAKDKEIKKSVKTKDDPKRLRQRTSAFLKSALLGTLYGVWGYFLGGLTLPFGALPFGVAFLSASDRRVFYIYAGLCVGAWGKEERVLLISVYTALLLIRLLTRLTIDSTWRGERSEDQGERTVAEIYPLLFSEHISLRMAVSAVGAFAIGLYRLINGGMMYYDLYGTIISVVAAPLSVLLVSGFFSEKAKNYAKAIGFVALAFGVIYSVGDTKLYGVSLAAAGCTFVTLYVTRRSGTITGILTGAILGLAVSIESVPIFAFAALSAGLLFPISVSLAVTGALAVSVAWGIYVQGLGILNGLASALVSACLLYTVCDKLFFSAGIKSAEADTEKKSSNAPSLWTELERVKREDTQKRINDLGNSFEDVSKILKTVSEKLQAPNAADMKQICDNAFDACCTSCENKSSCWKDRYRDTSSALSDISSVLQKKGSVSMDEVDGRLVSECLRLPDILSEINHNAFSHLRQLSESDRTEIFAKSYSFTAEFIGASGAPSEDGYTPDSVLGERLCAELSETGADVSTVLVFGKRQRRIAIMGDDRESLEKNLAAISEVLSDRCPFPVGDGIIDPREPIIRFTEKESLSISSAQRNLAADGEETYCGDTSGMFKTDNGMLYAFISDGMGSGREAALTSGLVGVFLKKFLTGSCSPESTVGLVNEFLCNRGGDSLHECSATVDIMELDLFRSKACFYKCGAAPTYVFRNGSLFKLRSHTVPVGIIGEPDLRRIDFDVSEGDLLVMVSDGVTDGKEECPWLFDLLRSQGESATPDKLADLITKYARSEGSADDISVIVVRIE